MNLLDEDRAAVRDAFDQVAPVYDSLYQDRHSRIEDAIVAARVKAALSHVPAGSLVVDLGCGTGHTLELLPELTDRYVGIDFSPLMIRIARQKFPEAVFVEADVTEALGGSWSLPEVGMFVSLFTSLNHIPCVERAALWRDCSRRLRRGGRAVFMFSTFARWLSPSYVFADRLEVPFDPVSAQEVYTLAEAAGLRVRALHGLTGRYRGRPWLTALEAITRGVLHPDRFEFIVVEAEKRG